MTFTKFKIHNFGSVWLRSCTIRMQNLRLMRQVFLDIDTEGLVEALIGVLVIQQYLLFVSEARDLKFWTSFFAVVVILILRIPRLIYFIDFEYANWVSWNACLNKDLVMDEFCAILIPSLLLNNIRFHISEFLRLAGPGLGNVVVRRQQHLNKSIILMSRWIVHNNEEWICILVLVDWALHHGFVLGEGITCLELILQIDLSLWFENIINLFLISLLTLIKCHGKSQSVVLCDILELSASDGIVMGQDSKDVFVIISLLLDISNLLITCLLVNQFPCKHFLLRME